MSQAAPPLGQREARILFTLLKARFILWVKERGWAVFSSEGYVGDTDAADGDHDGPHKAGGAHYLGTGEDMNLVVGGTWVGSRYIGGTVIKKGGTPEWLEAGTTWKAMHPLCRSGIDFGDDNHIGIAFGGRA